MVNWDQWQTLLAVYRNGAYARAANSLGLDATTVSRRIKQLEKKMGCSLFERHNTGLFPTTRCEELLTHIETASEEFRVAEQNANSSNSESIWRSLHLTAPPFVVSNLIAPRLPEFVKSHDIYIELLGMGGNVSLSRREADIALRIDDNPSVLSPENDLVDAEQIGSIRYAVYCNSSVDENTLPWAGLKERNVRTSGMQIMAKLSDGEGIRYRVFQFESLIKIVESGVARAMLPCFLANSCSGLKQVSDVVLEQPLWMLSHRQDRELVHLESARSWLKKIGQESL